MAVGGELRIRPAVRALVVDPAHRVLLVRFEFPDNGRRWALPGGGLEPGEQAVDALRRELAEEVGLLDVPIGPLVWTRLHLIPFFDRSFDGQRDEIHLVRTAHFDPRPGLTWEELRTEFVHELRWWSVDEIAASHEHFVPALLATHLRRLIDEGPPTLPVDVGV